MNVFTSQTDYMMTFDTAEPPIYLDPLYLCVFWSVDSFTQSVKYMLQSIDVLTEWRIAVLIIQVFIASVFFNCRCQN